MPHGVEYPKEIREEAIRLYTEIGLPARQIADQMKLEERTVQLWCKPHEQGAGLKDEQIIEFLGNIAEANTVQEAELIAIRDTVVMLQKEIEDAETLTVYEKQEIQRRRYLSNLKLKRQEFIIRAGKLAVQVQGNIHANPKVIPCKEKINLDSCLRDSHGKFDNLSLVGIREYMDWTNPGSCPCASACAVAWPSLRRGREYTKAQHSLRPLKPRPRRGE